MKKRFIYIFAACCALNACQEADSVFDSQTIRDGELINVGGVSMNDQLEVSANDPMTRAAQDDAAEKQEWLVNPLKQGLDITYGSVGNEVATQKVAILKLLSTITDSEHQELDGPDGNKYVVDKDTKWGVYSFKYRVHEGEGQDAWWHGNGAHYFEGQYVPQELRFGAGTGNASSTEETVNTATAPGLHSNQTNKVADGVTTGNYTLLEQYLGMPANTRLSATVARIRLPFRHRLCRVIAYVLIDPAMGPGVTLEGYKKTEAEKTSGIDNPETTELHFSNVDVLAGVDDALNDGHHTLTPKWKTARKVVPHFVGERGSMNKNNTELNENFLVYMDIDKETYTFPTNDNWASKKNTYETALSNNAGDIAKAEKACGIRQINYGKVPVYDIIARPTYEKIDNVMYDEEGVKNPDGTVNDTKKREYLNKKNKIDFDLTLSNGLQYSKEFTFDLNANVQTVVYLRINPESVDYNSSGSEVWVNETINDDYYGIDNQNGNSLSIAGSSWQRAYTLGTTVSDDKVTDGGYYNQNTTDEDGTENQYLTDATWKKFFAEAYAQGTHHGDYFILNKDITIDASELPENFVFTGHLDAQGHTITFTGANSDIYELTTEYTLYPATDLYEKSGGSYTQFVLPTLYISREVAQARPHRSSSIDHGEDMMEEVQNPSLQTVMTDGVTYYTKSGDTYTVWTRPDALYTHRTGATALFCGLNGIYTTTQEEAANPYAAGVVWEANVHKEKNKYGEYWVPYKGTESGWRAEVINTRVIGTLFTTDAVITGNVQNCYDGAEATSKVENHTPEYPRYNN